MKYLIGVISVLVVVVLVGSVMVPIINDSATGGVEYEDNPDWDGWVRFDLNRSAAATYHLGMWQDVDGIYVDNITSDSLDRQIYDDSATVDYETIMYADSNIVIWSVDDTFNVQGKVNGQSVSLNGTILDVIRSADGVAVTTESDSVTFDAPSWAYVPLSTGAYGFYHYDSERGVEHPANAPYAVLGGGNVGVYAYNNVYTYDGLGLAMNPIVEDGLYYGATWEKGEPEIPDDVTLNPLDPSIIGGGDEGTYPIIPIDDPFDPDEPLSVPTPTYTDGDWGYDLVTIDNVQYAKIVSYSGAGGGEITVPATIGGYDVYSFGKDEALANVFDTSLTATNLVISPGIKVIGASAMRQCTGFTGTLTIPDTVIQIGASAFQSTNFTGPLVIPGSVKTIDSTAFNGCKYFTSLELSPGLESLGTNAFGGAYTVTPTGSIIIPNTVTSIGNNAFSGCTAFKDSIVIPDSVTYIGSSAFNKCNGAYSLIIASNAIPNDSNTFYNMRSTLTVLDLSDVVDYSVDRYGLSANVTIYDTIGDCLGFVSIVTTAHGSPGGLGQFSPLMFAIPLVVIGSLLVAFAAYIIRRDY